MTFPTVNGTNTGADNSFPDTWACPLPSGITAGELLIVIACHADGFGFSGAPSGWTALINTVPNGSLYVIYKTASGSEGSSVTISFNGGGPVGITGNSYRISGFSGSPEAASSTGDPPNLAPSWGADDNLWLAASYGLLSGGSMTAPSNYSSVINSISTNYTLGSAQRALNASSENPGTFGSGGNRAGCTIAIRGVAPPGQPAVKRGGGTPFMGGMSSNFGRGGGRW